jgi:hypothetical protein
LLDRVDVPDPELVGSILPPCDAVELVELAEWDNIDTFGCDSDELVECENPELDA